MRHVILVACGSFNPVTNMHLRMFELARDALAKSGRYRVLGGIASPVSDGYKKPGLLPAEQRLEMLRLALRPGPGAPACPDSWVQVGAWESGQDQWTPTVQVLRHYQSRISEMPLPGGAEENGAGPEGKRRKTADPDDLDWLSRLVARIRPSYDDGSAAAACELPDIRPMLLCGADVLASFATPGVWRDEDMVSIVRDFGMVVLSRPGCDPQKFVHSCDLINPYERNIVFVTEWAQNDISSTLVRRTLARNESVRYLMPDPVIDYIYRNRLYGSTADWPRLEEFA